MKKKFILCACHYYRRIQSVKVQAIYSACLAAGVDCTVVPDLCRVSAKHEPINAEDCTILGCQTRAIKTLIGHAADWIDIRSTPTDELLEKYADRWDWEQIIDSYGQSVYDRRAIEFYEKFKDYIPVSKLQNTYLWRNIVEQRAKQLAEEITA